MARFHLRFKQIDPKTLEATEELFAAKPWRESQETAVALGQKWLDAVCPVYELPLVRLEVGTPSRVPARPRTRGVSDDPLAYNPGEEDVPDEDESELLRRPVLTVPLSSGRGGKFSLFQLFKHFRIYMLDNGISRANQSRSKKDDVHGWACSLFYTVRPVMFRARVRQGRIKRIHPDELLSQATLLAQREQARTGRVAEVRQEIAQEANAGFEDIEEPAPAEQAFQDNLDVHSKLAGESVLQMHTRPLRRYATQLGMANTWDRNKESILGELGVSTELADEARRRIENPPAPSEVGAAVPQ